MAVSALFSLALARANDVLATTSYAMQVMMVEFEIIYSMLL